MALPLSQNAQARALLRHLLEHGDTLGMDIAEGTIIQLALHDRALERFLTFDAAAAEWRTGAPSTRRWAARSGRALHGHDGDVAAITAGAAAPPGQNRCTGGTGILSSS